jgi:hypothetical protein
LKCILSDALEEFYTKLDGVSLAALVDGNTALSGLLKVA